MENQEKKIDITKYPEGPQEIIKYMDYLDTDEERMRVLWSFVYKTFAL